MCVQVFVERDGRKMCDILSFTSMCMERSCHPAQSLLLTGTDERCASKTNCTFNGVFLYLYPQTAVDALHRREAQLALKEYENAHRISEPRSEYYERIYIIRKFI